MIQGFGHAAITVRDMSESIRFYTQALGLQKAFSFRHPDTGAPWIEYLSAAPGEFVELFYGGSEAQAWHDSLIGFNHICLGTDDIFTSVQKIKDAGYTIDTEPVQGVDLNWQAWTKDPNGIRIELMQIMPGSPQSKY